MQRTNIYLEQHQTAALDALARQQGLTRAEVVRRLIDRGLQVETGALQQDLDAIETSFGVLQGEGEWSPREPDARDEHLDRLWHR